MICSQASVSARAQDLLRLPESMTIIKNRTDNLRFSLPLVMSLVLKVGSAGNVRTKTLKAFTAEEGMKIIKDLA